MSRRSQSVAAKHRSGSAMSRLINPVSGIREEQIRKGITPKNHNKDSRKLIKEIEQRNKEKNAVLEAKANERPFVLSKFSDVPSLVYSRPNFVQPPKVHQFLKAGHGFNVASRPLSRVSSMASEVPNSDRCSSVSARKNSCDYVKNNAMAVIRAKPAPPQRPTVNARPSHKPSWCFVPKNDEDEYLPSIFNPRFESELKMPTHSVQRHRPAPEPIIRYEVPQQSVPSIPKDSEAFEIPEGYRELSEEERVEALEGLRMNKVKVERELARLPLLIETPSHKKWAEDLELDLRDLTDAIAIFSQPRVAVPIEDEDIETANSRQVALSPVKNDLKFNPESRAAGLSSAHIENQGRRGGMLMRVC
eukprot:GDKJ01032942.1.p1 GENE.GDKJ01032942.1~~GDKJ01032942.1.p1  ORF type:complete len:361 (+),score=50.64 GDKJ01032942.1:39-1121(+)